MREEDVGAERGDSSDVAVVVTIGDGAVTSAVLR